MNHERETRNAATAADMDAGRSGGELKGKFSGSGRQTFLRFSVEALTRTVLEAHFTRMDGWMISAPLNEYRTLQCLVARLAPHIVTPEHALAAVAQLKRMDVETLHDYVVRQYEVEVRCLAAIWSEYTGKDDLRYTPRQLEMVDHVRGTVRESLYSSDRYRLHQDLMRRIEDVMLVRQHDGGGIGAVGRQSGGESVPPPGEQMMRRKHQRRFRHERDTGSNPQ